ncbi:four-domain proteases inhibitor-like [Branchiostoma floridae]|uniref:Four-domain proteases inhibitor-like n=1 Tax=Branchiostoma floridae TaxID=7739 RepID=A0A9J7HKL9_BRAFL|nr:four-domain proteases inhibitor-like [Branchiostoma floridae]
MSLSKKTKFTYQSPLSAVEPIAMFILCFVASLLIAGSHAKSLGRRQYPVNSCTGLPNCASVFLGPVCGSDGHYYISHCDIHYHACLLAEQFSHEPDFKPLTIVACDGRETEKRQFTDSGCPMFCNLMYAPVCGSNGQTYSNSCFLNSASCQATFNNPDDEPITLAHQGGCNGEGLISLPDIGPVMVS